MHEALIVVGSMPGQEMLHVVDNVGRDVYLVPEDNEGVLRLILRNLMLNNHDSSGMRVTFNHDCGALMQMMEAARCAAALSGATLQVHCVSCAEA
eukprot:6188447-Pleurochrysis_carterae.AAC.5